MGGELEDNPFSTQQQEENHTFLCPYCGKMCSKKRNLTHHIYNVHGLSKKCDICERNFLTTSNLNRHKTLVHKPHEVYNCMYCNKIFKREGNMWQHKRKCSKNEQSQLATKKDKSQDKEYECNLCDIKFTRKYSMKKYNKNKDTIQSKEGSFILAEDTLKKSRKCLKDYICNLCPRLTQFYSKFNLLRHKKIHHATQANTIHVSKSYIQLNDEEWQKWINRKEVCNICKCEFTCIQYLEKHKLEQHGIKKYQCSLCKHSFCNQFNLRIHMKRVHNSELHPCSVCHKKFKWQSTLNRHYRYHSYPQNVKYRKPEIELSRWQLTKRMKQEAQQITSQINSKSTMGKQVLWQEIIKNNPEIINDKINPLRRI